MCHHLVTHSGHWSAKKFSLNGFQLCSKVMPSVVPIEALTRMASASALSTVTMTAAPHASLVTLLKWSVAFQKVAAGGTAAVALPV